MHCFDGFYSNKTVLVTGHTGFKGSWLSIWLQEAGADVVGYALDPYTERDNFSLAGLADRMADIRGDIRDQTALGHVFDTCRPDIVFHLAAQPLVRASYEAPVATYEVNVMGSIHVMEQVRRCPNTKAAVMVTSIRVEKRFVMAASRFTPISTSFWKSMSWDDSSASMSIPDESRVVTTESHRGSNSSS